MFQDPSISKSKRYYFYSFLLNSFPFPKIHQQFIEIEVVILKDTYLNACVGVCVYKCLEAFQQYPESSVNDVQLFFLILCKRRCIQEIYASKRCMAVHHRYFALYRLYLKRDGLFLREKSLMRWGKYMEIHNCFPGVKIDQIIYTFFFSFSLYRTKSLMIPGGNKIFN